MGVNLFFRDVFTLILRSTVLTDMKKYASAVRSTEKVFHQTQLLQAVCDTSIARVTGCVYPCEGYRSDSPAKAGVNMTKTSNLVLRTETV